MPAAGEFRRYHIETHDAPDTARHPTRFRVEVRRLRLVGMVLHELLFEYRGQPKVALSRPCVYGVFGRVVGGLAPRHELCVGCLRCTTQYPEMVRILPNPKRQRLGDSFLTPDLVDTILYEARSGRVPVRGAGYRGAFGGPGWDGMWTDMSEIVRPTRDGIHGREYISTDVDIGGRPWFLQLDVHSEPVGLPPLLSVPVPYLLDAPPERLRRERPLRVLARTAAALESLAILRLPDVLRLGLAGPHVAPLVTHADWPLLERLKQPPRLLELEGWDESRHAELAHRFPEAVVVVRVSMDADLLPLVEAGVRSFHLVADYHGRAGGRFARELIQDAHLALVRAGRREEVTLIGSGGIAASEHVPKALLCGLDAVALDTALWVALQARFDGELVDGRTARIALPSFDTDWGETRLLNMVAAWRDQLLEVLGAMGLREVRRLRGELGRCMFQKNLEDEAFAGIEGYAC